MALYNEYPDNVRTKDAIDDTIDQYFRTNNQLIKDDGDNPSGKKLVDPDLKPLFKYHFGTKWGDKNSHSSVGGAGWVVLPKGRVVSVDPEIQRKGWDLEKMNNVLTICNGGADLSPDNDDLMRSDSMRDYRAPNKPAGISTVNVYEDEEDRLTGNLPAYTTRANITLPFFASKTHAEEIEWGSAYALSEISYSDPRDIDLNDISLKPGDFVKSDENGRITKWTDSDGMEQIIGRVDQVSTELVPQDFLKWVMPDMDGENVPELLLNKLGYDPEDIIDADFFDPSYADGYERNQYMPLGIPGLTDGMNITMSQEDVELLSVASTEVGDTLQLRVPSDEGKFDPSTISLKDQDGNELLSTYAAGALAAEGSTDITDLGTVTITGGEHADYNMDFVFATTSGTKGTDDGAAYDSGTDEVTVTLVDGADYNVSEVESLIHGIGETTPTGVSAWTDFTVASTNAVSTDAVNFDGITIEVTGGQSEGPQRLEITHTDPYNHLITVDVLDTQDTNDMTIFGSFEATHALPGIPTELDWDGVVGSVDIVINL